MDRELTSADLEYYKLFPNEMEADGVTQEMLNAISTTPTEPLITDEESAYELWLEGQKKSAEEASTAINTDGQTTPLSFGENEFLQKIEAERLASLKRSQAAVPVDKADSLTKQDLYGEKPSVSVVNRLQASFQDLVGDITGSEVELSEEQKALEDLPEAVDNWEKRAQEIYGQTGVLQENGPNKGQRIYTAFEVDPEDPTKLKAIDYVVPEYTSNMWARIINQGGLNVAKDFDGLSRREFTTDSSEYEVGTDPEDLTYSARTPSMQLAGGEQLVADLWTLAVPLTAAAKPVQLAFRGAKMLVTANRAAQLGKLGSVTATTVSASVLETLFVSESQGGLLVKGPSVQKWANAAGMELSDKAANDLAVLTDGLLINGALDGVLTIAAPVFNFITGKGKVAASLKNLDGISQAVQDGLVLNVAQFLDPSLVSGSAAEIARKLKVLSKVLNNNAVVNLQIADFTKAIPVPTTQAINSGAEAYMRETKQHLKNTMTPEAFEAMIQESSDLMFGKMVAILRSNSTNPALQNIDASLLNEMGKFFSEFADSRVAGSINEATDTTVNNLTRQIETDKIAAGGVVDDATEVVGKLKTQIDNVVPDNPDIETIIETLQKSQLEGTDRTLLNEWTQSTAFAAFNSQKEAMEAAFKAIPNDPIGPEAAEALIDNIMAAVQEVNVFDSSGRQAKNVLNKIYSELLPTMKPGSTTTTAQINDITKLLEFNTTTLQPTAETRAELIKRIGKIGFQDVYNLRPTLKEFYNTYAGTNLANRFTSIRKHINNRETGQLSFAAQNTRELADTADQAYKNFDNRWQSDKNIQELTNAFNAQRSNRNLSPSQVTSTEKGVIDSNRAATQYVDSSLAEVSGEGFQKIMEAVDGLIGMTGPTKTIMSDLIQARMAAQLALNATSGMDAAGLNRQIAPYLAQLRAAGSDDVALSLQNMVENINTKRTELGDELLGAEDALIVAKQQLKQAENNILNDLLSKVTRSDGGVGSVARTDTREALVDIISRPDANNTKELLVQINKLPVSQRDLAMTALQSVALDTIGSKVFGTGIQGFKEGAALRNIQPSQLVKMSRQDASGLMKNLDLIFPEEALDPLTQSVRQGVFTSLEVLYDAAGPTLFRDVQVGSNTALLTQIGKETRDAVSTSILVLAGYMNPTAALLRRLTASSLDDIMRVEKEVSKNVLGIIIASPTEFANLIDLMRKRAGRDRIREAALLALRTARLDGRYQVRIREEEDGGETGNPVLDTMTNLLGEDMTEAALGVVDTITDGVRQGDFPERPEAQ